MLKRERLLVGSVLLAGLLAAAVILASVGRSGSAAYGVWAPRFSNLAAASRLQTVVSEPAALKQIVEHSASATGGDPVTALGTLRLLRGDLGATHAALYAYAPTSEGVCVLLWDRQGTCPTGAQGLAPGLEVILSPGGPGYPGQPVDVPPALAGVVADDIRSVTMTVDGISTPLAIQNNSFFTELTKAPGAAFTLALQISYADGSTRIVTLEQPAPVGP